MNDLETRIRAEFHAREGNAPAFDLADARPVAGRTRRRQILRTQLAQASVPSPSWSRSPPGSAACFAWIVFLPIGRRRRRCPAPSRTTSRVRSTDHDGYSV
jgi:hypothetical protein